MQSVYSTVPANWDKKSIIQRCQVVPYVTKILQNFWLTLASSNNNHSFIFFNSWKDKVVYIFRKGIDQKVNVIVKEEFELPNFKAAVQYISHDAAGSHPSFFKVR